MSRKLLFCGGVIFASFNLTAQLQEPPGARTLDTPRDFPGISSQAQWRNRARDIHDQILVSAGLWPMPDKPPLRAKIFDRIEKPGYSIEKVRIEVLPGFYLCGNLYRPVGKGSGPFPAILNPHGHWENGRLTDIKDGSVVARCISFARQGMIAFAYDMVGYNDTRFADSPIGPNFYNSHHHFAAADPSNQLWNISLMGLQTWDSIRALDFIASLPDADPKRLACTGASGGGTQTFILGAIDDRLAVQAPAVMVSHTMQGGCVCENMPGLRVEYSNVEIAASAAPRPQIMVAATGDWTKTMPTMEGPSVEGIYRLFNAGDKLRYVQFNFGHNYNQTSREAVYGWFGKWLVPNLSPAELKEAPYSKEADEDLLIYPHEAAPSGVATEQQVIDYLKNRSRQEWNSLVPRDRKSFKNFKELLMPAWRHTLQCDGTESGVKSIQFPVKTKDGFDYSTIALSRSDAAGRLDVLRISRHQTSGSITPKHYVVILADDAGGASFQNSGGLASQDSKLFEKPDVDVWIVKTFTEGPGGNQFSNFFTTYNRTLVQQRVRDLLSLVAFAEFTQPAARVVLCGNGRAGLWCLLAAPRAHTIVADCCALNVGDDEALLAPEYFCPGMRCIGGFEGVASLAAPSPLLLYNIGENFRSREISNTYASLRASPRLGMNGGMITPSGIADWIFKQK